MKNSVLKVALVAGTLCMNVNTNAQEHSHGTGGNQPKSSKDAKAASHTVLSGNWSVIINPEGKLCVYDKNDNIIKVIDGGMAAYNENGSIFNSAATYPYMLSVDKIGNLHIMDMTGVATTNTLSTHLLPFDSSHPVGDHGIHHTGGESESQFGSR